MITAKTPWQRLLSGLHGYTVEPVRQTELAEFYWSTDIKVPEISAAFCNNVHSAKVAQAAGSATFGSLSCNRCDKRIYVLSRKDAVGRFERFERGVWRGANWASHEICLDCKKALYAKLDREHFAFIEQRNHRVNELKFMPYLDYLKTPEWRDTRKKALHRAKYCCQMCSENSDLHVHHRTYARRGAEWNIDLIVLCSHCHSLFHGNGKLAQNGRAA